MAKRYLDASVTVLPGIGGKRAQAFARLGIEQLRDLLYHFPRGYQNRGEIRRLSDGLGGEVSSFLLTVASMPQTFTLRGGIALLKFYAFDESGRCEVAYFRQNYLKDVFTIGAQFRFFGRLQKRNGVFTLTSPAYEPVMEGRPLPPLYPVYPLSAGLTQKIISAAVRAALTLPQDWETEDPLPKTVREKYNLCDLRTALYAVHLPQDFSSVAKARERFVWEELFFFALGIVSGKRARPHGAPVLQIPGEMEEAFTRILPFTPTGAQMRVIREIEKDLQNPDSTPMARLVSGDVGSGKTVCAAAAAYFAAANRLQSALMVPTEILAQQHAQDLTPLLGKRGVRVGLLTGSLSAAAKRKVRQALQMGELDLLIGTHALITEEVQFANLGLVITDEQHRFGIFQRAALAEKGKVPHMLVMSATPIPRTLALILYGDLAQSAVDEMPPGRQKVDTFVVDSSYRPRLQAFLQKIVSSGHQAYVVCPCIEQMSEEEEEDGPLLPFAQAGNADITVEATASPKLQSAVDYAMELQRALPDCKVRFLHGKMKSGEKEAVMEQFAAGKISILVSTTVIEVGVNVPNATLMVVENAERFGLSQLHQLRGRVGRGQAKAYCVLVSDAKGETARRRLAVMKETNDGYQIAQEDLALRGPGDFFPSAEGESRQHGAFRFRLANLCEDMTVLQHAFAAAEWVQETDDLRLEEKEKLQNGMMQNSGPYTAERF